MTVIKSFIEQLSYSIIHIWWLVPQRKLTLGKPIITRIEYIKSNVSSCPKEKSTLHFPFLWDFLTYVLCFIAHYASNLYSMKHTHIKKRNVGNSNSPDDGRFLEVKTTNPKAKVKELISDNLWTFLSTTPYKNSVLYS